jgi:oxepin-CoA hydrolase/3-oxo-5,6-dehydrosuberyl-CoA semialdehyde dehydrogenase
MLELRSYLGGQWRAGGGARQTLLNPATEAPLASASTEGLDLGAALEHARAKGGPALRALSFAQRGALIKGIADAMQDARDEPIGLGISNGGNTRSDAKFDVDGAIATLLAYAEIGTPLGEQKVILDGEGIQLGRSPRFHGQHVLMPRRGVAVHVNAFNFPAWGFAEKAAVALLAGMPVLAKPATSSALLAVRIVELLVEQKLLPEGALSLLVGAPRDLIKRLGAQDVLAFTGSGDTGERIRTLPNIIRHAVRVNVEADSLNAAVLGPDVEPRSDMYELFLKEVVRDMTQKAGQKCTAIRRIIVPAGVAAEVKSDLAELLAVVKVGDPADEETKMGPLATASQLADAHAGVERLGGKIAFGGTGKVLERGFFISPILIDEPGSAVHEHEVFGPIASLIAYSEDLAAIVNRGNGGLVCSIYSEDQGFLDATVAEIAPFHGRIYLGHPKIELSPGPGTVLPQLVHGGPGKAGGGEELGGARGLAFYLQRTALEGSRPVIAKITGIKP